MEPIAVEPEAPVAVAEAAPRVRKGPAAWATADEPTDPLYASAAPPVEPAAVPPTDRGPRRPLTFQELIELTARQVAGPVEVAAPEHGFEEPGPLDQIEVPHHIADSEPIGAVPFEVLGHVSEYTPAVEAIAAEPEVESHVSAPVDPVLSIPERAIEEVVPAIAAAHPVETAPEPLPQIAAIPEPAPAVEPTPEPLPEPMAAEVPEFHFSDRYLEESTRHRAEVPPYEPYRPNPYELDDIEPVYEEASRNLSPGRWDPIPPLRPSVNSWRDRPSPVPANGNGARHYRSGEVKDGFNSYPPQRWIPEDIPPVEPEPEPLSEPMLSRQWGLLSKFQQSRLTSGSRPATGSEGASESGRESDRDADRPGSKYGDHRS